MTTLPRVSAIVGPTASGKSSLSERVATALGSSVVSIDAMQIYRGMDIGTAKTPFDQRRVPLLMVDIADIDQEYSVQLFQREARACIDGLLSRGLHPVLCGGTGLYLDAVIDEMDFPAGEKGSDKRAAYEEFARAHGGDTLHALLSSRDPRAAQLIHPNNVRRVIRALEMADEGVSYADQNATLKTHRPHYDTAIWAITMRRERLYQRIDIRVDHMFDDGLVEEVSSLVGRGLTADSTAGQAIGYKEVLSALEGSMTLDEARELIKKRTRRYAKRQLSWLRRDGRVRWLDYDTMDEDEALRLVLETAENDRQGEGH